jgi:hypothetical protein
VVALLSRRSAVMHENYGNQIMNFSIARPRRYVARCESFDYTTLYSEPDKKAVFARMRIEGDSSRFASEITSSPSLTTNAFSLPSQKKMFAEFKSFRSVRVVHESESLFRAAYIRVRESHGCREERLVVFVPDRSDRSVESFVESFDLCVLFGEL